MPAKRVHWRMPTADEAVLMGLTKHDGTLDDEMHKDLAAAAVVRIEDPKHPLQGKVDEVAKVCGLTVAAARKRATDRDLKHR
jgi:hypothetical protein